METPNFKVGSLVKYKDPYPDEDPDQLYEVLELFVNEHYNQAKIRPVDFPFTFPPTYTRELIELELVESKLGEL